MECLKKLYQLANNAIACRKHNELREIQPVLHLAKILHKNLDGGSTNGKDGIILSTLHNRIGVQGGYYRNQQGLLPSKPYNRNGNEYELTNHLVNQCLLLYATNTCTM